MMSRLGVQHWVRRMVPGSFVALAGAANVLAGEADVVGLTDLQARLGAATPTGDGVVVAQIEATESGNYQPNPALPQFANQSFVFMSGASGASSHANAVGNEYYGTGSIANGIPTVYSYSAAAWAQTGYLRTGQGNATPPVATPGGIKIMNNSWLASFTPDSANNDALRRADFAIDRDELIMCNGVDNVSQGFRIMPFGYNGIAVGKADGVHEHAGVPAGLDGAGRLKPEIVAPGTFTSYATPVVAAGAALMRETAVTDSSVSGNANATRSEVLKAVLLAGAVHRPGWTNNPVTSGGSRGTTTQPIDSTYGVDLLNVDRSHMILTGREHDGAGSTPGAATADWSGWDLASVADNSSVYYRFSVCSTADEVSILATWHRIITAFSNAGTVANFTLTLWSVDGGNNLQTLVGNPGLGVFGGGNVVSQSAIDNIEHLYITNLQPGNYVLQVSRSDGLGGTRDVAVAWLFPQSVTKVGDLTGDCQVNIDDFSNVVLLWGTNDPAGDADMDGDVDIDDYSTVILFWGT